MWLYYNDFLYLLFCFGNGLCLLTSCLYPSSMSWHKNSRPFLLTGDLYYFNYYMLGIYVVGNVSNGPSCSSLYFYLHYFSISGWGLLFFAGEKIICLSLHSNDLFPYSHPNSRTGTQSTNFQFVFELILTVFYIVTNILVHYFSLIYFLPTSSGLLDSYGKDSSATK